MQNNYATRRERRLHRRFAIDLDVYVSRGEEPARAYRMRDYCESGLLLVVRTGPGESEAAGSPPFAVGQLVEVSGGVRQRGGQVDFRVTVQVVRLVEDGFGARFQRPEARLFKLLQGHTRDIAPQQAATRPDRQPPKGPSGTPVTDARIEAALRRLAEQNLTDPLRSILESAEIELLEKFNQASSNLEEQQLFTDLSTLDLAKSELGKQLLQPLLNRALEQYRGEAGSAQEDSKAGKLSLVDEADFENWVQVAKASSRLSDTFSLQVHEIAALIRAHPPNNQTEGEPEIPFSPLQITDELSNLSVRLDLSLISHQHLLQTAARVLSRKLGGFYEELKSALEDLGLQPDTRSHPAHPADERLSAYAKTTSAARPAGSGAGTPPPIDTRPFEETSSTAASGIGDGGSPAAGIGVSDLSRLVPQLQADAQAGPPGLPERLRQMAAATSGGAMALNPEAKERAEFAGQLLEYLTAHYSASAETAPLLEAVQVPLVRAILTDPGFFRTKDHPALRLVDQLEHLGSFITDEQESPAQMHIRSSVDQLLARLHQSDGDEQTLHEVAHALSELTTAQSRDYQFNVERLVATCTGQDRLQLSRIRVRKELDQRYGGRQVPAVAVQLLDVGWRSLLELVCLRDGDAAPRYRQYLSLLDNLVRRLGGEPHESQASPIKADELVTAFEEGLSSTSFDPLRRTQVLERMRSGLLGLDSETARASLELVTFDTASEESETTQDSAKKDIPERAWRRALEKVESLDVGDRVNFTNENGGTLPLRVAWVSDVDSRLTLVNQQGLKEKEVSRAELARLLHFRQANAAPAEQTILSERAVQEMLKRMEDRLAYHTSHDSLTGLYNRPQFQSALERALSSNGESASRVLCWMNLDNFSVFNDTCSYEVGDKLLVTVAGMLEQHFGQLGVLGHLGGDKFGALLNDCSPERGAALAETFRSAVEQIPFYWNGRSMPVSISIALVDLAEASDSLAQLMQAADAALSAAKQARGNQVYRYSATDHAIRQQRESMQWMLLVNQALEHGRLSLRCQKIAPIDPGKGFSPHYEVLLGVTDESGKSLHIGNFISAAEKYNRMAQVDRWVVSRAISWVAKHRQHLAGLGGFAINLSGHTLNDEGFVAFVDELFQKTQVPGGYISFEVTETLAIANLERAGRIINALKDLGCKFALDDFGTGLSSYSYLKSLPVDHLKIDGAFVKEIHSDRNNYAVVKSINEIAHFMGKRTIAEYVENADILRCLQEIGVDYAQGYGIEKPRPLDELAQR